MDVFSSIFFMSDLSIIVIIAIIMIKKEYHVRELIFFLQKKNVRECEK